MKVRPLPKLSKKKWAGFTAIYLAGFGWLSDIIIPFTKLNNKVLLVAIALGFAEIMFFLGVALLGREYYQQIKAKLLDRIKPTKKPPQ